jgi:ELWxxDGT repeat protein
MTAVDLGVQVTEFDDVVDVNGTVFFAGRTQSFVNELWRTDGTPQGTSRVTQSISSVDNFTEVAGALFFTGRGVGMSGEGLYRTDGTADGGATLIRQFESIDELVNFNGTLFFEAIDPATGRELWKSHGTPGTTTLVKDLNPGAGSSDLGDFYVFKDQLFFYGGVLGSLGWELYKSDGTAAGTGLVKDILPGERNGAPLFFMEVGGKLFFSAQSSPNNYELWRTDGTAAGTVNVRDLPGDSGLTLRDKLAPGVGLAITRTFDYPQELWRLDAATGNGTLTKVATLTDTANRPRSRPSATQPATRSGRPTALRPAP